MPPGVPASASCTGNRSSARIERRVVDVSKIEQSNCSTATKQ
jgi:hypothetical protein